MKTPREILLARHRGVEPKLDAIRARALAAVTARASQPSLLERVFRASRLEFFRIPRVAWGGLAAAWLVIIVLNVASRDAVPTHIAPPQEAKRSPETLLALHEQKRLFAELVGAASEKVDAEAPRLIPRPRSERQLPVAFA